MHRHLFIPGVYPILMPLHQFPNDQLLNLPLSSCPIIPQLNPSLYEIFRSILEGRRLNPSYPLIPSSFTRRPSFHKDDFLFSTMEVVTYD